MSTVLILGVLGLGLAGVALGWILPPPWRRILAVPVLLGVAAFCTYGFVASGELGTAGGRTGWRAGYGITGLAAIAGAAMAAMRSRPRR